MPLELCHPRCFGFPIRFRIIYIKVPGPFHVPQFLQPNLPGRIVQKDAVYALLMSVDAEPVHGFCMTSYPMAIPCRGRIVILRPATPEPAVQEQRNVTAALDIDCSPVVFGGLVVKWVLRGYIEPVVDSIAAPRTGWPVLTAWPPRGHTYLAPGRKCVATYFKPAADRVRVNRVLNLCRHRAAAYLGIPIVVVVQDIYPTP